MTIWMCQKISWDFQNLTVSKAHSVKVSHKFRQLAWPDVWRSEQHDGKTVGSLHANLCWPIKSYGNSLSGHSLSLTVKSLRKGSPILCEVMGTVGEICVLVKYSPKQDRMLGSIVREHRGIIWEIIKIR